MKISLVRSWVFPLNVMIFIITFAVIITMNSKWLYYININRYEIEDNVAIDKKAIKENYSKLIEYQSVFYDGELNLPGFTMSKEGRIHFEEVKVIFETVQYLSLITGVISLAGLFWYLKNKDYLVLKRISLITFFVPMTIGLLAVAFFNQAFVLFHNIMFNNEYWIFDPRYDPVIDILPQEFFMDGFMMIVGIVVLISWLFYFVYKKLLQKEYNENISL
jgi:integral membrane protein TIGR01906